MCHLDILLVLCKRTCTQHTLSTQNLIIYCNCDHHHHIGKSYLRLVHYWVIDAPAPRSFFIHFCPSSLFHSFCPQSFIFSFSFLLGTVDVNSFTITTCAINITSCVVQPVHHRKDTILKFYKIIALPCGLYRRETWTLIITASNSSIMIEFLRSVLDSTKRTRLEVMRGALEFTI